jgi:hypothetical protein
MVTSLGKIIQENVSKKTQNQLEKLTENIYINITVSGFSKKD